MVEGNLAYDAWENDKGEKRNRLRVRIRRLHFVGNRRKEEAAAEPEPADGEAVAAGVASGQDAPLPF